MTNNNKKETERLTKLIKKRNVFGLRNVSRSPSFPMEAREIARAELKKRGLPIGKPRGNALGTRKFI